MRKAGRTMKDTMDNEWNDMEDDNNFLNMDPNAEKVSFTSDENAEPNTLQIIMRTEEISVDDDAELLDAETAKADVNPLERMWNMLVQMVRALHKLVYEGIKRSEWKNFLREGEDMKKFGKKIAGFLLAAVLAVTAAFPAFAASLKTAVGKIYLTIDSTVGLKNDSEDVTVTPYGDNTDLYYVDNIYIENNDGKRLYGVQSTEDHGDAGGSRRG